MCNFYFATKTANRRDTALSLLEKSGFVIDGAEGELNSVHQDKRCPGLLHHHPALRANFAQSQMVKEGLIILQVRFPINISII